MGKSGQECKVLDMDLAAALVAVAHGEVGREVTTYAENCAKDKKLLRGRQAFWLICQWFKIAEEAGSLLDLADLLKVQCEGVGLPTFLQNWNTVLSGMKVLPDDATLATLFHLQVKHCKQIEFDVNAYD
jgi:hypothetical protein